MGTPPKSLQQANVYMLKIPFSKPSIDEKEEQAVLEVLRSGWLTSGPKVKEFEAAFAKYVGAKHAIAVNSCTSALFLAVRHVARQHTFVECPSLTFSASAAVIAHTQKKITFVDVDLDTMVVQDANGPAVVVDLTGNEAPVDGKYIIHDCAHRIDRNMCKDKQGTFCFSFYPTKNLASSEGGMICTDDDEAAKWYRLARSHGQTKDNFARYSVGGASNWEYSIEFPGWKMNMTDIQAAIGLEQLKKLPEMNRKRRTIIARYNAAFNQDREGLHLYPILVKDRQKFMEEVHKKGIGCSVHFLPLHLMPAYLRYKHDPLPNTEYLGAHLVSLPLFPSLTDPEVEYIIKCILETNLLITES